MTIYPGGAMLGGPRWHGSCCVCAGRIELAGEKRCTKCSMEWAEKQTELRRLQDLQKRIVSESVSGKWFAGEEPDR